jgi:TolB-like protein/Tfp pilus assembly protein PilF
MAIISELKRRNVFRVAAYYLALSWLVMQITDVLTSVLQLPEWTGRFVFALLIVGFPVAVFLAWAFELTPDGLRRETEVDAESSSTGRPGRKSNYLLVAVVVVALAGYGWNQMRQDSQETDDTGPIRSVVVLPFENLMNDPDQDFFVEGMHDALITQLSKINSLHIISQTSAMHYAGSDKPLRDIARELNVDAALEGSVLRAGDVVRVTTQLIDARNDRNIWSDNFDRQLVDILALYNDVTREITYQVRVTVTPEENASLDTQKQIDPIAYELYLKGKHLCENWSPQEMQLGADSLLQAIELDPDFAASHAQLAMCLVDSAFFEYVQPEDIEARARAAATRAVQLDSQLAEAHVAMGSVYYYLDFVPESAEVEYVRALELNGNSIDTLLRLSWFYAESARFDEAHPVTQHAVEMDPLSTPVRNAMGQVYYLNREFDQAAENFEFALNLDRSDPSLHYYLGLAYEQQSQYDKAIELFQSAVALSDGAPLYLASLGHAYGQSGMADQAAEVLAEIEQAEAPSPFNLALVHLGLGNTEKALQYLDEAIEAGNFHVLYLKAGPRFDGLRTDPGFAELLARIGW